MAAMVVTWRHMTKPYSGLNWSPWRNTSAVHPLQTRDSVFTPLFTSALFAANQHANQRR